MHRMPIGPMGADRKTPIDTQPTNMDIIVPKKEVIQLTTYKDRKKFSVDSRQLPVFLSKKNMLAMTGVTA